MRAGGSTRYSKPIGGAYTVAKSADRAQATARTLADVLVLSPDIKVRTAQLGSLDLALAAAVLRHSELEAAKGVIPVNSLA
jgi:hypothetical protein